MTLNQTNNFRIVTPHACVIIWNYNDRLGVNPTTNATINTINETILDTISCTSIHTSKGKGSPAGSFTFELAPWCDWVSRITAGSWCTILMSNQPITPAQLPGTGSADPSYVKMIGKIESVRADVVVDDEGARHTRYVATGTDWGHIFNNTLYIDNLIASASDPTNQGNAIAVALQQQMTGDGNTPSSFKVVDNLVTLLGIFGSSTKGLTEASSAINRIDKSIYDFLIPPEMARYFNFVDADGNIITGDAATQISNILTLQTGKLSAYNTYADTNEAYGFIDPFSLQGTNSFWQILLDNSNPALNELYNEIEWDSNNQGGISPSLTIYNRIKPFSYVGGIPTPPTTVLSQAQPQYNVNSSDPASSLRSYFTFIKTHTIDNVRVLTMNVGTNWRDKYNFVEIRPLFQDFDILAGWTAQKSQGFDTIAFNREGFRPMIVGTKQFPVDPSKGGIYNADQLVSWVALLKEWYFNTHKLLNGTLTMTGSTEYVAVGNNILFEAGLINPTININNAAANSNMNTNYVLAHVENIENHFNVTPEGARTYTTVIQFVRGIVVNKSGNNYIPVGSGSLDELASTLQQAQYGNTVNTVSTSDGLNDPSHPIDPDPKKLRGT